MTPESVGLSRSKLVMGKHSGRHAFKSKLEELGFTLSDNEIQDAFVRFKDLADAKKDVYDEDIIALVDDAVLRHNDRLRFVSLQVICGSKGPQTAELEMEIDGTLKTAKATGNRSEEHTSELQSLMRISYAVFCLKKKKKIIEQQYISRSCQQH